MMDAEPFLPANPLFRFLFLFRALFIAYRCLRGRTLWFLLLFHNLFITFGHFRGCSPFAATGTPFQSWAVGVGCMNCIPFVEKLVDLWTKHDVRTRWDAETNVPQFTHTVCISWAYLLVISVNFAKTCQFQLLIMMCFHLTGHFQ